MRTDRAIINRKLSEYRSKGKYVPGLNDSVTWTINESDHVVARVIDYAVVNNELHALCEPIDGVYRGINKIIFHKPLVELKKHSGKVENGIIYR